MKRVLSLICAAALLLSLAACGAPSGGASSDSASSGGADSAASDAAQTEDGQGGQAAAAPIARTLFLQNAQPQYDANLQPQAAPYTPAADFSDVINVDQFDYLLTDGARQKLTENGFVVLETGWGGFHEFFDIYENNRYALEPSFVTSDAMMHTYHLYFSRLLKGTEKGYFIAALTEISRAMQAASAEQLAALAGTPWETAAKRNLAYFSVALSLLEPDAGVPDSVLDVVRAELALIDAAGGITESPLMNLETTIEPLMEDYSQYIPRGYYDTDEALSRYFKAMMWYGRMNFRAADESQTRSALLMELALETCGAKADWEKIYTITSFFVGASDDAGPYEYAQLVEKVYAGWPEVASLPENAAGWQGFMEAVAAMEMPAINSIPVYDTETQAEREASVKGFRFMGQRFVLDAGIFQKLVYRSVEENEAGERRMLPSALDVPAALGSAEARAILTESGADAFPKYAENMEKLQTAIAEAPASLWTASLYGGWLDTLRPLLEEKGEGYPTFMRSAAWQRKSLNTFLGSWTELKHDTILYAKQVMAEMGGGPVEERDDRGYVEPQAELYAKLAALCAATRDGLAGYGVLSDADSENLTRLAELAQKLAVISEKELLDKVLDEEEYELIRSFGGTLEHFWYDAMQDEFDTEYPSSQEYPAAVVADVATDPNGTVLEVGTGGIQQILVLVTVDGSPRIARGGVYSFYEFPWPLDQRLTDTEWRDMVGVTLQWTDDGNFVEPNPPERPAWTQSFLSVVE